VEKILSRKLSQMKKGILEFVTLSLISKKEFYGYDIITTLRGYDLNVIEGTLYPILARLRKEGLIVYKWIESTKGPPRKYYSITEDGEDLLEKLVVEFNKMISTVDQVLKMKTTEDNNE